MHSYTLMCNVCTDSIQEQLTPKNTSHSTMLSENDTFFTVLKNTEKERVQVLGMTNWKDIAQIFLQRVSEQILSSSLQCKCAFSYSYAVEYHKPQTGKCPEHSPEGSHIDTTFSNEATQCHLHDRLTDAGPQSLGACEILLPWKIPAAVAQPHSLNEFRLHSKITGQILLLLTVFCMHILYKDNWLAPTAIYTRAETKKPTPPTNLEVKVWV